MLSVERFKRIATIVVNANPDAAGRFGVLRRQLTDLLINVGVGDDETAAGAYFRQESNKPINHRALAKQFARIAKSRAPLDHPLCTGELRKELVAVACRKWPERLPAEVLQNTRIVRGASTILLSKCTAQELRDVARERAKYHASFVQRRRPTKQTLNDLIEQLADIYASITDYPCHHHCLSDSVNSQFAQFCRAVLEPFFDPSEVSLSAISKRWKRLQDDASRRPSRIKKPPKRRGRPPKKRTRPTV